MEMKMVLKLELNDDKAKQKALKAVSGLSGINSISMDMKGKKLTVIGDVDPINVVTKLRKMKLWHTEIITVGPAKEPEKKKEEAKKVEEKKKDPNEQIADLVNAYRAYNPHHTTYYQMQSIEENPNTCAIS